MHGWCHEGFRLCFEKYYESYLLNKGFWPFWQNMSSFPYVGIICIIDSIVLLPRWSFDQTRNDKFVCWCYKYHWFVWIYKNGDELLKLFHLVCVYHIYYPKESQRCVTYYSHLNVQEWVVIILYCCIPKQYDCYQL